MARVRGQAGELADALGRICAAVLPVPDVLYRGNPGSPIAVCTLSSTGLLEEIAASAVMDDVCLAGRLLSENRGIDSVIRRVDEGGIGAIIVCGVDARGHMAGRSLFDLHNNGTDADGRIAGSVSPDPYLESPARMIEYFRDSVSLVDMVGCTSLAEVRRVSSRLSASCG